LNRIQVVTCGPRDDRCVDSRGLAQRHVRMTGTKSQAIKLGNEPDRVLTKKPKPPILRGPE
jgi:hypothetical protein